MQRSKVDEDAGFRVDLGSLTLDMYFSFEALGYSYLGEGQRM